jgi:hypothetical protein
MLDVLPAIAFAALVLAWLMLRRRPRLQLRADLTAAIEGASIGPIVDAGSATLVAVASALALDPRDVPAAQPRPTDADEDEDDAWHVREIIRPLGLEVAELEPAACPQLAGGAAGRTLMRGTRHGRPVSVALREDRSEVRVGLDDGPGFEVALTGGEWQASGIVPDTVTDALEGVAPNRRWEGAVIRRDAAGIALRRTPESSRSWMHDLWLAELVARAAERSPSTVADGVGVPAVLASAVAPA